MSYLDHPFLEWPSDGHACSTPRCPSGEHVGRQAATGPTILHSTKSLCLSSTAQRKDAPSELLNMHQFGNIRRRSTQEFRVVFYAGTSQTLGIAVGNAHPTVHRDVRTGQQKPDVEHQPPLNGYLTFLLVITLNIVNLKTLK